MAALRRGVRSVSRPPGRHRAPGAAVVPPGAPRPWGREALAESGVDPAVAAELSAWTHRSTGRVLLIRRPGRTTGRTNTRRWFHVDSRPGREAIRTGTFRDEHELPPCASDPGRGEPFDGPLYLACTHGRHDTCCAVFGRPLAAVLAATELGHAYECSHLGGCRFAAALVALPHGYVFGRVTASEGVTIARDYTRGRVRTGLLRGRTSFPPVVQAAQYHARIATGADGVDALRPVEVRALADGHTQITMVDPDCVVELREVRMPAGRPLTCATTTPGWIRRFDLVDARL